MGNRLSYPVVDLSGKVAMVTGGNTGIGYEISKALAEMGAHTFIACKLQEGAAPANAAIDRMKAEAGEGKELKVEYLLVDLASFSSVKDFVRTFKEKNLPLHILINNAGVCAVPFCLTEDGFDLQFQVNYLSGLFLTLELLPNIQEASATASGNARIIFVSSNSHRFVSWDPDNFNPVEEGYVRIKTYALTKMYNIMVAFALQRRLQNFNITVFSEEPGYVWTDLRRNFEDHSLMYYVHYLVMAIMGRTPEQGAITAIYCAVNPDLDTHKAFYYSDCHQKEPNTHASNEIYQEDMWRKSLELLRGNLSPESVERFCPPPPSLN